MLNGIKEKNEFISQKPTKKTQREMRFNVIITFENVDQDMIDIDLPKSYYSDEEKFVKTILDCLEKEDECRFNGSVH